MGLLEDKFRAIQFYKYFSRIYDYINPIFYSKQMRELVIEKAKIKNDSKILEVGCGTGFTTEGIATKISEESIFALDISRHQLSRAIRKFKKVNFILGDAEALPFKDCSFDSVISAGSLEYWPNPKLGISEMARVTKSGGTIVVLVPRKPNNPVFKKVAESIMLFPSTEQCVQWFQHCGLEDIEVIETGPYSFWKKLVIIISAKVP